MSVYGAMTRHSGDRTEYVQYVYSVPVRLSVNLCDNLCPLLLRDQFEYNG